MWGRGREPYPSAMQKTDKPLEGALSSPSLTPNPDADKRGIKRPVVMFILGLVVGMIIVPLGAYLYVKFDYAPVAVADSPFPFEKKLAHGALKARIAHQAPREVPIPASEENLLAGAKVYRENCAVCHGVKGEPKTATARGLYPPPPQLFQGKGVTDDPVGETYWIEANGVRLTGMPGYKTSLSEKELWQVSHVLAKADQLPSAVYQVLMAAPPAK